MSSKPAETKFVHRPSQRSTPPSHLDKDCSALARIFSSSVRLIKKQSPTTPPEHETSHSCSDSSSTPASHKNASSDRKSALNLHDKLADKNQQVGAEGENTSLNGTKTLTADGCKKDIGNLSGKSFGSGQTSRSHQKPSRKGKKSAGHKNPHILESSVKAKSGLLHDCWDPPPNPSSLKSESSHGCSSSRHSYSMSQDAVRKSNMSCQRRDAEQKSCRETSPWSSHHLSPGAMLKTTKANQNHSVARKPGGHRQQYQQRINSVSVELKTSESKQHQGWNQCTSKEMNMSKHVKNANSTSSRNCGAYQKGYGKNNRSSCGSRPRDKPISDSHIHPQLNSGQTLVAVCHSNSKQPCAIRQPEASPINSTSDKHSGNFRDGMCRSTAAVNGIATCMKSRYVAEEGSLSCQNAASHTGIGYVQSTDSSQDIYTRKYSNKEIPSKTGISGNKNESFLNGHNPRKCNSSEMTVVSSSECVKEDGKTVFGHVGSHSPALHSYVSVHQVANKVSRNLVADNLPSSIIHLDNASSLVKHGSCIKDDIKVSSHEQINVSGQFSVGKPDSEVSLCESWSEGYDVTDSQSDGELCNVEFYERLSDAAGDMASAKDKLHEQLPWKQRQYLPQDTKDTCDISPGAVQADRSSRDSFKELLPWPNLLDHPSQNKLTSQGKSSSCTGQLSHPEMQPLSSPAVSLSGDTCVTPADNLTDDQSTHGQESSSASDNSWAEYNKFTTGVQPYWVLSPPPAGDTQAASPPKQRLQSNVADRCESFSLADRKGASEITESWDEPSDLKTSETPSKRRKHDGNKCSPPCNSRGSRVTFRSYDSFRSLASTGGYGCRMLSSTPRSSGDGLRQSGDHLTSPDPSNGIEAADDSAHDSSTSLDQIALCYHDSDNDDNDNKDSIHDVKTPSFSQTVTTNDSIKVTEPYKPPHRRYSDSSILTGNLSSTSCTPGFSRFSVMTNYWAPDRSPCTENTKPTITSSAATYTKPCIKSRRPLFSNVASPKNLESKTIPAGALEEKCDREDSAKTPKTGPQILWCSGTRQPSLANASASSKSTLSTLHENKVVQPVSSNEVKGLNRPVVVDMRRKSFPWSTVKPMGPEIPKPTATVHPMIVSQAASASTSDDMPHLISTPFLGSIQRVSAANPLSMVGWSSWKDDFKKRYNQCSVKYIDTHCHIDFLFDRSGFTGSLKEYLAENSATVPENFGGCVAVFCNPRTFYQRYSMYRTVLQEDGVWGAIGCHPKSASDFTIHREMAMKQLLLTEPKFKAVGEIGLDYSGHFQQYSDTQKAVFIRQIKMAVELQMPIVIHCRDAEEDCVEILKQHVPMDWKIHRHCFTGSLEEAKTWIKLFPNSYLGLTPLVTHRSERAYGAREVARFIPLRKLILETDAPYFIPRAIPREEMRWSHPGLAITVAGEIAFLKGISFAEVLQTCLKNSCDMYGISVSQ